MALFRLRVHLLIGNGSLCLSGEKHQSQRGCSRSLVQAGGALGRSAKLAGAPGSFQCDAFVLFLGMSKSVLVLFKSSLSFLQPATECHWFQIS